MVWPWKQPARRPYQPPTPFPCLVRKKEWKIPISAPVSPAPCPTQPNSCLSPSFWFALNFSLCMFSVYVCVFVYACVFVFVSVSYGNKSKQRLSGIFFEATPHRLVLMRAQASLFSSRLPLSWLNYIHFYGLRRFMRAFVSALCKLLSFVSQDFLLFFIF